MNWMKRNLKTVDDLGSVGLPPVLAAALNSLPLHSVILDNQNQILFKSNNFESLNILSDARISNENLLALVRLARRNSESASGEFSIKRGAIGDAQRQIWCKATVINEEGSVLLVIDDESERTRIDAIRRDFITNISHELKTPITALGLNSDALLISLNDADRAADFAKKIKAQSQRLADLVQEIIYLSRLQDTDPELNKVELKVIDVIKEAVDLSETNATARNIWVDISNVSEISVNAIKDQLVTAVHNLIENAINYSPDGTRVSVNVEIKTESNQELVEISVKDQGIGIAESELQRIFERFYRVDPARSRTTGGTGLGLSIVKHVAQNHGGEVKVWSTPGIGSTFTLRIPLLKNEVN